MFVELANYEIKVKRYTLYVNGIEWNNDKKVIEFDYRDKTWHTGEERRIRKDLTGYFFLFRRNKINISGLIEEVIL